MRLAKWCYEHFRKKKADLIFLLGSIVIFTLIAGGFIFWLVRLGVALTGVSR